MGNPNELVDIVDENDVVVDTVTRREMRGKRLRHRGVFIAVVNDTNELLIHQRADNKDIWPSRWDVGAGGVVSSGESYLESATRELEEELGITVPLVLIGHEYYEDEDVALFGQVFVARHEGPFRFDDGEVVATEWVSFDELEVLLPQRSWCSDSIAMALPMLLEWARALPGATYSP
jgi:8-oxo-dGTP pyrophosphatase MutT (NUDIX family)